MSYHKVPSDAVYKIKLIIMKMLYGDGSFFIMGQLSWDIVKRS